MIANADSGYSKIIFRLLAFAWQLAYWRSIDANHANLSLANFHMDSFLDWSFGASSTELGWPLLIQKFICLNDRVLHKLATGLLLFLHSRNLTGILPHLKRMRVDLLNIGDLNSLKYLITKVLRGLLLLLLLGQTAERWLTQGWFWDNLLLIFSSLSSFLFSLFTASFFLFALPTGGFYRWVLPSYGGGNQRLWTMCNSLQPKNHQALWS